MNKDQEKILREVSSMSAFTFYLDDITKLKALRKLKRLELDTKKGSLSATLRVLLNLFAEDRLVSGISNEDMVELIRAEYLFTTKKNKRSSL